MRPLSLSSELTLDEARMRALQYRQMADTADARDVQDALIELAERYEVLAHAKGKEPPSVGG